MDNDPDFSGPVELPGDKEHRGSPKFRPKRPLLEIAKKPFLILMAIAAVSGIGYGTWKAIPDKKDSAPAASVQNQPAEPTKPAPSADIPEAANSELFKSNALRVEINYPKTWKVSEADGGIRIVSPEFNYQTASIGEKAGHFRIYIRKGAREVDGKYIGRGVAIKPSEKLVYSNPGVGQRKDTLLSLFGTDSSASFGFFLIAGNFQLDTGNTLGPTYGREPDTYIIGGGYSDNDLADDLATNSVPIEYLATSKAYAQAIEIVKSIKL